MTYYIEMWQLMVFSMYSFRNDSVISRICIEYKTSALVLLWNLFQSDQVCERKKRLYSYAMHSNTVLWYILRCTVYFVPMWCWSCGRERVRGLVTCVHDFEYDEYITDVAKYNNSALSVVVWRSIVKDGLVYVRISVCMSLDRIFCGTFCATLSVERFQIRVEPSLIWG